MDVSRLHTNVPISARACTPGAAALSQAPEALPPPLGDALTLGQYVATGLIYKAEGARIDRKLDARPPLDSQPRVSLDRPFVMVPGWTTRKEAFEELGSKLTEGGANGGRIYFVQDGEFFVDPQASFKAAPGTVPAEAKVFEVVLRDVHSPPDVVAGELSRNFEAICQATGAPRLDVEAYSMGGLGTRVYLDRGGQKVGRLMMLGTPNRGTRFAELARHVIQRDIRWAMSMGGLVVGDLPALNWMAVDGQGQNSNPRLRDLNSRWPQQASRVEAFEAVAGQGQLTPAEKGKGLFTPGDGLVPLENVAPPGARVKVLEGTKHHGSLNREAETYQEMIRFFGWTPIAEAGGKPA